MRWVLLVLFACGACGASGPRAFSQRAVFASSTPGIAGPHPAVLQLPVITRLRGGPTDIVVRGEVSPAVARRIARTARATYLDVNERFLRGAGRVSDRPVDVCVFRTSRQYRRFVHEVFGRSAFFRMGFYMSSHRLVVADLSRGIGNLRHELVHPLLRDVYPDLPDWLNEGIASLYGTAHYRSGKYRFDVSFRLRHLRRALRRGTAPSLVELAVSSYDDVHGPRERAFYATSRYLLLYIYRRGQLESFFYQMVGGPRDAAHQLALLRRYLDQRTFLRWVGRLSG